MDVPWARGIESDRVHRSPEEEAQSCTGMSAPSVHWVTALGPVEAAQEGRVQDQGMEQGPPRGPGKTGSIGR